MARTSKTGIREPERRAPQLVASLKQLPPGKVLQRYISHIRFPLFKNIEPGSRIDFTFPVTALVGPNGCGKTSALHALYGAPHGRSTSDFWFATDVDPIKEGNGQPNRFIYGHWLDNSEGPVETRKARVGTARRRKPGYFEPTKAVIGDDMDTSPFPSAGTMPGQSKDRWNPVDRPLLYMNFRSELSAFDKYLFWANPRPTKTIHNKHERLQLGAKRLRKMLETGAPSASLFGKIAVFENRSLSYEELDSLCAILGKEYAKAQLIRHKYYGNDEGLSIRFETKHAAYSEAFAGSGELAVASLVIQLCSAKLHSLVLLDEPEVSLHPGAQERLLVFLMEEALKKKHQIVFTTHSPGLIRHLPPDAIKVFHETADGRFAVVDETHPYAAFNRLGAAIPTQIRILVEDRLAKHIVDLALLELSKEERALFEVTFLPGGASSYFAHRIPTLMHDRNPPYLLLDADQKPPFPYPQSSTIPASDDRTLQSKIHELTRCDSVQLSVDGGNDTSTEVKRNDLRRKYIDFLYTQVHFLPETCPEDIVLRAIQGASSHHSPSDAKTKLAALAVAALGKDRADDIDGYARVLLSNKRNGNQDLEAIATKLRGFLNESRV